MLSSKGGGVAKWGGGRESFPICFPLREDGRVGQHEIKTHKAAHNKVRYIVTQMLHIADPFSGVLFLDIKVGYTLWGSP